MRRTVATGLVVLASLLLFGAALAGYARRAVFDSERFANRATAALQDPAVRSVIGERVTDQLVLRNEADLLAARPIIASAVSGIVGSPAFRALFRRAVLDVHRAVFARDEDTVTLTLADIGTVAGAALEKLRPQLAAELERSGDIVVVKQQIGSATAEAARIADDVRVLAYVLIGLTVAAAIAALLITPDRRVTVAQLGIGAVVVGVVIVIALTSARAILLGSVDDPDTRDAVGAVWTEFLGDLRRFGWLLAGTGTVVAAAAASLLRPVDIEGPLRAAWRVAATEPARPWPRVGRALALVALGALIIAAPLTALQVLAMLAGVYVLYSGLESLLRLVYRPAESEEEAEVVRRVPRVVVPILAGLLIAAGVAAFVATGGTTEPAAATTTTCNGSDALCDRALTRVVLPATHNSMSVPARGWFSAEQDRPIGGQLEDGIRGLLLDTHYADRLQNGNVRTFFGSTAKLNQAVEQGQLSQESVDAALRLRDRLGYRGEGERGMYLCHTFCELGATPLADGLKDIRDFLATHPAEVVVVINQDYVTPADFVGAMDDAGLSEYAFTPPVASAAWPSLRTMIDSGRRLVVLAENEAGAAPWYQLAYERLLQETPFTFPPGYLTKPANLPASCRPNRGLESAPLFLINHWVSTDPVPRPSDAERVNAYAPLLARARECQKIRGHLPNLLAVNFYKRGDVFRVVDTLNGTG
ncbi:MAG TPA: hypothetical protein VFM58_02545 [Solirubrobacteraceae bacterium]|nr:hypothetical protein [Solirubrobacteraceae bacterium]